MKSALYIDPAFRSSAGIEQYTRELIKAICKSDDASEFIFLSTDRIQAEELTQRMALPRSRIAPAIAASNVPPRLLRYAWSFAGLPTAEGLTGRDLALVHSPWNIRIPTRRCPLLLTIHDVYPTKVPSLLTLRQKITLTPKMEAKAVKHAAHIIADSENTKLDLCTLFGILPDKVTVVPLGIDHDVFKPVTDNTQTRHVSIKYGIEDPFILFVGSLYPRKIGNLLKAFRTVCEWSHEPYQLVIVGGRQAPTHKETTLQQRVQELGLESKVVLTGVIPQEDVQTLMSAAEVFVYVSFYEGFGLSPLEAMACGAPVVVSKTSSLPEVVGEAGLLVDPADPEDIASAITQVLTQAPLRERLRRQSLLQAQRFSWDRTMRETFDVYRRVAQLGSRTQHAHLREG